jgi:uncharacterized coiled-coil protein SlyX
MDESSQSSTQPSPLEARVMALEELVTHLERTVAELNGVLLDHSYRVQAIEGRVKQLTADLNATIDDSRRPRRLEDDKPPHY